MDFVKFYDWAYQAAIVEMEGKEAFIPSTRQKVYESLVTDDMAMRVSDGKAFTLTLKGVAAVPGAKSKAKRLLQELVRENDKLVHKLVGQVFKKTLNFVEEEDLYQSGLIALVKTLEKFDPSRFSAKGLGASFASYLRHWVRHYTQKSTSDQQPIHHPRSFGMPYPIHKKAEDILSRTGVAATAEQLGVTEEELSKWRTAMSTVVPLDTYIAPEVCLSKGVMADDGLWVPMGDASDMTMNPEEMYERAETEARVEKLMSSLKPLERKVIEMLREGETYRKIAQSLNLTEDYIRKTRSAAVESIQAMMEQSV